MGGERITTLKELLRPGLKAVIVGLNPSPLSVQRGHYWQGTHGQRLWSRLREWKLATLRPGREDEDAFAQGFGFADLVRRPTRNAAELSGRELSGAAPDLAGRLRQLAPGTPMVLFRYRKVEKMAGHALAGLRYQTLVLPSPYEGRDVRDRTMLNVQRAIARL